MQGGELAKDLLYIEIVALLNQGLCHLHHLKVCPHSEELLEQCGKVCAVSCFCVTPRGSTFGAPYSAHAHVMPQCSITIMHVFAAFQADQVMDELEHRWAHLKRELKGDLFCIDAYGQVRHPPEQ